MTDAGNATNANQQPDADDASIEAVADAYQDRTRTYTTDTGEEVEIRKATVQDYPVVTKVARSVLGKVNELQNLSAQGDSTDKQAEVAINFIEDNMPTVIKVVESLTSLTPEEVNALSLSDMLNIVLIIWELNSTFFMQVMAMVSQFRGSTPQAQNDQSQSPAAKKRRRKK